MGKENIYNNDIDQVDILEDDIHFLDFENDNNDV